MLLYGCFAGRKLSSFCRYFHVNVQCDAADKQLLSQLRKTTGFPFVNCRKALERSNNDLKQVRWRMCHQKLLVLALCIPFSLELSNNCISTELFTIFSLIQKLFDISYSKNITWTLCFISAMFVTHEWHYILWLKKKLSKIVFVTTVLHTPTCASI